MLLTAEINYLISHSLPFHAENLGASRGARRPALLVVPFFDSGQAQRERVENGQPRNLWGKPTLRRFEGVSPRANIGIGTWKRALGRGPTC